MVSIMSPNFKVYNPTIKICSGVKIDIGNLLGNNIPYANANTGNLVWKNYWAIHHSPYVLVGINRSDITPQMLTYFSFEG